MSNKQKNDFNVLWKIIQLSFPYKALLISTILATLLVSIFSVLRPELIQRLIDNSLSGNTSHQLILVGLILANLLIESLLQYFFIFNSNKLGQNVVKNFRTKVFKHIVNLNLSYFDKTPIGTSTTRTVNDIETINEIFTQGFIQLISDILTLILVASWMFYKSWQLAIISMITLPLMVITTYVFKESVKVAFNKVRTQVALLNAFLQEHITGMRIVQVFGAENQEYNKFEAINEKHKSANIDAIWAYSIFFPLVEILLSIAIGLMVWLGSNLLVKNGINSHISVGLIVQFVLLINMMFRPIRFMAERFNTMQMGIVAATRVFDLLDTNNTIENNGTISNQSIAGKIEFKNVSFAYLENEWVLKNVSFVLPAQKTLAIIGHTGSGKSSIINLISRLYNWQNGEILLDDVPSNDYDLSFYRKQFSTVLQDVFLFSGSIYDNIRVLDNKITDKEIEDAAKLIGAYDFISKLPGGFNYQVKERGVTLSLGQRQLISFVRALVFNPKILILDEATSSVDTETEHVVQQAIDKLIKNRTSIVIAHRLSTIKNADFTLVLNNGTIVDFGRTEDVLKNKENTLKNFTKEIYD